MNTNILNLTDRLVPVSVFSRGQGSKIFDEVSKGNEYVILKNNEPIAVLVSLNQYRELVSNMEKLNQLLEQIENEELLSIARSRINSVKDAISFEEVLKDENYTMDDLKELAKIVEIE